MDNYAWLLIITYNNNDITNISSYATIIIIHAFIIEKRKHVYRRGGERK